MKRRALCLYAVSVLVSTPILLGVTSTFIPDVAPAETVFGTEPGGRTIGGPGQTVLEPGSKKQLFTFLRSGPAPVRFVCVTGANIGSGTASVNYTMRIGRTMTATFSPGDSRVVCAEVTAIGVECHRRAAECNFLWRVDELR